jgi:hypothetical protein
MTAMIRCGENSLAMYCLSIFAGIHLPRHAGEVFGRGRYAGRRQYCSNRRHDRRRDCHDLDRQTGSAGTQAVLRDYQIRFPSRSFWECPVLAPRKAAVHTQAATNNKREPVVMPP